MSRRYYCPACGSSKTIKKGKRRGSERRRCKDCGKWFSLNRRVKEMSDGELTRLHLSGISYRTLGDMCGVNASTICRKVNQYLSSLPTNADITRAYCSKFCGMLVLDGKYLKIRGYKSKISLIWAVDYLTHGIPHFRLAPFESYHASYAYFQSLRLLNYPLQMLICDDNISFKLVALKVYPKTLIQTCANHCRYPRVNPWHLLFTTPA